MYSTPVIVHTISQQHVMYSTPVIVHTISQQHITYSTPMIVHTVCQQHITYSTLTIVHTVSQQSLRIVHLWFSTPSLNSTLCIVHLWLSPLSYSLNSTLHIVHLWLSTPSLNSTLRIVHVWFSTLSVNSTLHIVHLWLSTPSLNSTLCIVHLWFSTLSLNSTLHIVHLWFSTPSLNSGHVNGLRKGEIGMASWVNRLRKSVIACFPWKVRKGWLTHKQTEWSLLLFFQCALKERTEQGVLKTARATHSTLPRATAPQGHVSARQDGKERHAVTMLMSAIHHLPHSQCVLITQCAPILMEVSYVSAWKDSTSRKACVSVKTNLFLPYILSFSFLFLLRPLL